MMKTNSKEFNTAIYKYILDAISTDGYNVDANTELEKLTFLAEQFKGTANYPYNLNRYPNNQDRFKDYIMGLPSCFNIDFENYEILKVAKEIGSIPINATGKQEDKVISNWFNLIAFKTVKLFTKHNITL